MPAQEEGSANEEASQAKPLADGDAVQAPPACPPAMQCAIYCGVLSQRYSVSRAPVYILCVTFDARTFVPREREYGEP